MSGVNQFSLYINNNTNYGIMTLNALTNGISDPPVSSGNPPLVSSAILEGSSSSYSIQASGGSYWEEGRIPVEVFPDTTGQVIYNLPDNASILTISWDTPNVTPSFIISGSTVFYIGNVSSDNGVYTITVEKS